MKSLAHSKMYQFIWEKFASGGVDVALVSTAAPLMRRAEQNLGAQAMQESVAPVFSCLTCER